jgi:glutathione S-transferase
MRLKLYVVHGSHPCTAAEKALSLKGLSYSVVEWPPPMHVPMQRMMFGRRTVPALSIDGEKIQGSTAIMRRLDQLVPDPPLFPRDPQELARVQEAERWGDEVLQPVARELIWAGLVRRPSAMVSYNENSRGVPLPAPAVRAAAPLLARAGARLNRTNDAVARSDLQALPGQLDQVDAWIADGRIGNAEQPNAADLQIASTVRLLLTMADARPLIEGRPIESLARSLFPAQDGELAAGALPAA